VAPTLKLSSATCRRTRAANAAANRTARRTSAAGGGPSAAS